MNFDFLKNVKELEYLYNNCTNAEKLVKTMPVQSVFTSRKSAELLAKFIYLTAHNEKMLSLSFAEILSDKTVKEFIGNRYIMDAFHFIRKTGNMAVHGDENIDIDDAIYVLEDLHYITGEISNMLGLITDYPEFKTDINEYEDAYYIEEQDIDRKAQAMFAAYILEYNAAKEREKYEKLSWDNLFDYSLAQNVEMHEFLSFKSGQIKKELVEYVQEYVLFLLSFTEKELDVPFEAKIKLYINDILMCSEKEQDILVNHLKNDLINADAFAIDIVCNGNFKEFIEETIINNKDLDLQSMNELYVDDNHNMPYVNVYALWTGCGMLDRMEYFKRRGKFLYKLAIYYNDSGDNYYQLIEDGKTYNPMSSKFIDMSLLDRENECCWYTRGINLNVIFDYEKNKAVVDSLHNVIRNYLPSDELEYCEFEWNNGDLGWLLCDNQLSTMQLNEIQLMLDDINNILVPIMEESKVYISGNWEDKEKFLLAELTHSSDGLKLVTYKY